MVASCNLGTDVGGTFTDLAWCTPSGELHCFKVPSTPSRPGQSILEGVDELFAALEPDSATYSSCSAWRYRIRCVSIHDARSRWCPVLWCARYVGGSARMATNSS